MNIPSILVVAGEPSGEEHAAGVVRELRGQWAGLPLRFFGSGGREMAAAGVELLHDVSRLAAIGPWEALRHLRDYWRLYRRLLREVRNRRPVAAVLVDFPDFNLRLARRLHALRIPVCYFISPQIWAWRPSRLNQIRRWVDLMLVIFPFEADYYREHGVEARYVGNPTATRMASLLSGGPAPVVPLDSPAVALLPGSRRREVELLLPVQLDAARYVAERMRVRFWIFRAAGIPRSLLEEGCRKWRAAGNPDLSLEICDGENPRHLAQAHCAIIKSGTSTLEAMLLQVPFAMVYRVSLPSWLLLKPLVRSETFCLANLIAGRRMVPEFVQWEANGERIGSWIVGLLQDEQRRCSLRRDLAEAGRKLGSVNAYQEAARQIKAWIEKEHLAA